MGKCAEIRIGLALKFGQCLYTDGRFNEAEELFVQVMETWKKVLGEEHPDTLLSMNNQAFTWQRYGRRADALKLMEECVLLCTRILGANHLNTLSSFSTLLEWQAENLENSGLAEEGLG